MLLSAEKNDRFDRIFHEVLKRDFQVPPLKLPSTKQELEQNISVHQWCRYKAAIKFTFT